MKEQNTHRKYKKVEEQESLTFMCPDEVTADQTFTIIKEYGDRTTRNGGNFVPQLIYNMTKKLRDKRPLSGKNGWKRCGTQTIGADASSDDDRDASSFSSDFADKLDEMLDKEGSSSEDEQP